MTSSDFMTQVCSIDDALATRDSFTAERLMQRHEALSSEGQLVFVAALIGRLLLADVRTDRAVAQAETPA